MGHSLLKATYDNNHTLPFGRLKKLITDELNSGYKADQLYIMMKADGYSSFANVFSQAVQIPVVELNTDSSNWEQLLSQYGFDIIVELFTELDCLAQSSQFMLYVDRFADFNRWGNLHYNAKSNKLGGIADGAIEAMKASLVYSHSLTIRLPQPNSSNFYNALGNKQYKSLIKKFNTKFQQHSFSQYEKEHIELINEWLDTGEIPKRMKLPEPLLKSSEAYQKRKHKLVQKIKETYNSVGKDGRCAIIIEPSLSDLEYNFPDVVVTAMETLDNRSVQILDCYQIVKACATPGHQTSRVVQSYFQRNHTALFVVKNWESFKGHSKVREEFIKFIKKDNWCRVIFDLDKNEIIDFPQIKAL